MAVSPAPLGGCRMKCISLYQPWATLIILGKKRFETRSWSTAYRGPLAIHAAKKKSEELVYLCGQPPFKDVLKGLGYEAFSQLPRGVLLGTVTLEDVIPTTKLAPIDGLEAAFGDFRAGRYGWRLAGA